MRSDNKTSSHMMERLTVNNDVFFENVIALLRKGSKVTIPVKGTSMLPFIVEDEDQVVLEGIEQASPEGVARRKANIGDAVLFRTGNRYLLHRILSFDKDGTAVIQGDGILHAKEHCGREGIYGRVVSVQKKGQQRIIDVSSKCYRLKVSMWKTMVPFRRILLGVWKLLFFRHDSQKVL
jgi:hypothetical protein